MPKKSKPLLSADAIQAAEKSPSQPSSSAKAASAFNPPDEPQWHQAIAEAAYHLAAGRGFAPGHELEDWLAAEESVKGTL